MNAKDGKCAQCESKRLSMRRREIAGGRIQFVWQCLDCGWLSSPVKAVLAQRIGIDGDVDPSIWQRQRKKEREQYDRELQDRRAAYREYLQSDKWAQIRDRVLHRDAHTCQGCLVNVATEVHHMTYENCGAEFAFQLVSLCHECHERWHRENDTVER